MSETSELLSAANKHDESMGAFTKTDALARNLWLRSTHIWIVSARGRVLCHQRALTLPQESNPGLWNAHLGGYVQAGESYRDGGVREVEEEIGLKLRASDLREHMLHRYEPHHTLQSVFSVRWDGDPAQLQPQAKEVATIAWVSLTKILGRADWVYFGYEQQLIRDLQSTAPGVG